MEAVVALSVACNVLQVVETGCKVASVFKEVYRTGTTEDSQSLGFAAEQLTEATLRLQGSIPRPANRDDSNLLDVANKCADLAITLQSKITPLTQASSRKRDKFKHSMKLLWAKQDIEKLAKTLELYRDAMNTSILGDLRSKTQIYQIEQQDGFQNLGSRLQDFIRQQAFLQLQNENKQHALTRQMVQDGTDKLKELNQLAVDDTRRDRIISSLCFDGINARKAQISPAHSTTYEWIFGSAGHDKDINNDRTSTRPKWDDLVKWLSSDQHIYWISGKPGSGKSTLMSFIYNHEETRRLLSKWSGNHPLILLDVYLWNSGSEQQRSLHGLLCTVVVQILRQVRDLVYVLEKHSPLLSSKSNSMDWSSYELSEFFLFLITNTTKKFCIFIDGLDEAQTEYQEQILELIQKLSNQHLVKLCVSSRPYQIFEDAFRETPKLRLHNLNQQDIDQIFNDKLRPALTNARVRLNDVQISELESDFRHKAAGVFLWADLAVKSLKRGLTNCDTVDQLQDRLKALPLELRQMYEHIWQSFNEDSELYREQRTRCLKLSLMTTRGFTLSLLTYVLSQPTYQAPRDTMMDERHTHEMLADECERMVVHIKTRCVGLLEVNTWDQDHTIQEHKALPTGTDRLMYWKQARVLFVHRTARDFLTTTPNGMELLSCVDISKFDLLLSIVNAKLCEVSLMPSMLPDFVIADLLVTIRDADISEEETVILLQHIENACANEFRWISGPDASKRRALTTGDNVLETQHSFRLYFSCDFLGLTIECGIIALFNRLMTVEARQLSPAYLQYCLCCWGGPVSDTASIDYKLGATLTDLLIVQASKGNADEIYDETFYIHEIGTSIAHHVSLCSHFCNLLQRHIRDTVSGAMQELCSRVFCSKTALAIKMVFVTIPQDWVLHRLAMGQTLFYGFQNPSIRSGMIFECNVVWYLNTMLRHWGVVDFFFSNPAWQAESGAAQVKPWIQAILTVTKSTDTWGWNFNRISEEDSSLLSSLYSDLVSGPYWHWNMWESADGYASRNSAIGKMRVTLEMVRDRSPRVDGLEVLREQGWIKYADDPGVTRHPPPMFTDEVDKANPDSA